MGFVDLHSHVLAALDDGAPAPTVSAALVQGLVDIGFTEVCATPHQKAGQFMPSRDAIDAAYRALTSATAAGAPTFHLAAENMWDDVFFERLQRQEIPSYNGGPAFLFELRPTSMPPGLADHLFKLRLAGRLPVMAHPERYTALWDDEALLHQLHNHSAFLIDLGAIAGAHGRRECKAARRMVEDGLAHAVASDTHNLDDVRLAAEGIAWIRKRCGDRVVTRLLDEHPRATLAGELPG